MGIKKKHLIVFQISLDLPVFSLGFRREIDVTGKVNQVCAIFRDHDLAV